MRDVEHVSPILHPRKLQGSAERGSTTHQAHSNKGSTETQTVSGSKIMDLLLYQNPIIDIVIDIYVQYRYHQKLIESFHSQKLLPIDVLKSIINQQTSKL